MHVFATGGASQLAALGRLLPSQPAAKASGNLRELFGATGTDASGGDDALLSGLGSGQSPLAGTTLQALLDDAEKNRAQTSSPTPATGDSLTGALGNLAQLVGRYALAGSTGGATLLL